MFYAMVFVRNTYGLDNIRALRTKPYKTLVDAACAIERKHLEGYVHKLNVNKPVWSNVL